MSKYRKKPVIIEAILWTGQNIESMKVFVGSLASFDSLHPKMYINTLEGVMTGDQGDYIIKGVKGEFYPCKPDIFKSTYELVEE